MCYLPVHLMFFLLLLSEDCVARSTNHEECQYLVSCFSLWSLMFFITKSPVTHHYISCFSLWTLPFLNTKSPVSHYGVSRFSLWRFLLHIMKSPVSHYEVSCFSLWILLFLIIKSPVSSYEVSCSHYEVFSFINKTVYLNILFSKFLNLSSSINLTLILRRSRTGTAWFYTSTSNKRAAPPKLYTKSLTRDLKLLYSRLTLVRISINL